MAELYMLRTPKGLEPLDDAAIEALRRVKLGAHVMVSMRQPRNVKFHRRFFAMLNVVWQSCGDWNSVDDLLVELKYLVGHVEHHRVIDRKTGEVLAHVAVPKSIAFHAMDEDAFREFSESCIKTICEKMVPGLDDEVLREEVLRALS